MNPLLKFFKATSVLIIVSKCLHTVNLVMQLSVIRYYCRFQIVRSEYWRHSTKMLKTHPDGVQEVLCLLRRDAYDICIVTIRHAGHKDLDLYNFASLCIHIAQFITGKVDHTHNSQARFLWKMCRFS